MSLVGKLFPSSDFAARESGERCFEEVGEDNGVVLTPRSVSALLGIQLRVAPVAGEGCPRRRETGMTGVGN
jgi:hypothetical protein